MQFAHHFEKHNGNKREEESEKMRSCNMVWSFRHVIGVIGWEEC